MATGLIIPNPVPITIAMVTKANQVADRPRYSTAADWNQGTTGNDIDGSIATSAKVGAESPASTGNPAMTTQAAARAVRAPTFSPCPGDFGKDYGAYAGQAGRAGDVTPLAAYPDVNSAPSVTNISPNVGGVAGGTAVTLSGSGFTGATSVTFGGTAGTALTVVNANTITVNSPAKSAGPYDVIVTTPKGASSAGDKFTYS